MHFRQSTLIRRRLKQTSIFLLVLLLIEFLDELTFGAVGAAWPLIRDDLGLNYEQIGLLLGLPLFISNLIEPAFGILADIWKRRALILGGGMVFVLALLLTASSQSFGVLFLAFTLFAPASGAFVSLSQATLMDIDPSRHEQNMARWTFAGSVGVVTGPLVLGAGAELGLGWRGVLAGFAVFALIMLILAWRMPIKTPGASGENGEKIGFVAGLRNAFRALRRFDVLRWLVLLQFSDLMLDVLLGFLALYFTDVAGVDGAQATVAVAVWAGVGLAGDFLVIPLLERVRGLTYLRVSVVLELILYPAFLLLPGLVPKLVVLGLLGFFNAGWYSILQGQLYSSLPGQSGTAVAVGNVGGLLGSLMPLGLGLVAKHFGLNAAMWLLLAGPVALLIGVPFNAVRDKKSTAESQSTTSTR